MRILFLALDVDLSKQRGDTIHTVELARSMSSLGHEVTLVVGADGPAQSLLPSDTKVVVAHGDSLSILAKIRMSLGVKAPDIVYERRFSPKIGFALTALRDIPLALEVNGILDDELAFQGSMTRRPSGLRNRIRKTMMRSVARFIAVSPAIAEDLISEYGLEPVRVRVVGNGVNTDLFRPMSKRDACDRLGYDVDRQRLVFVGNLVGWRDFDTLLRAVAELMTGFPRLEVLIIGTGPESRSIRAQAKSLGLQAIQFVGELPHGVVPFYISASDICLLPERPRSLEISPLKLFEYMACGRPVVATRVPGLELVESEGVGRLFTPGDSGELSATLRDLLSDPGERALMGTRGRAYVERERSWISVASRIIHILREVIPPGLPPESERQEIRARTLARPGSK